MTAMTTTKLAIDGGAPVRAKTLPYGRPTVDDEDKRVVLDVLGSDYLTTGPRVAAFEQAFAARVGAKNAVAVSSGTAALHTALFGLGIQPGDEVIVPTMTFAASANAVAYLGGTPVLCDIDPETLLIDARDAARRVTNKTKAIVSVDFGGQIADDAALLELVRERGLRHVCDACHSVGAVGSSGKSAGTVGDVSAFSFHPVKTITTAEGGMVTTGDDALAARMRTFRNHGITTDYRQREATASFEYEMVDLGYNYRLSDLHCALGISQLRKLDGWLTRRATIADRYDAALVDLPLRPLERRKGKSAWHLYVIQLELDRLRVDRAQVFRALRAEGIGVNVHYIPVHHHPFYRQRFPTRAGDLAAADAAFERILTLPLFPTMSDADVDDVVTALTKVLAAYRR